MRLLTLILILTLNNLTSQELKNIDTTKSSISYTGNHFLHKWSAENNNLSGLIKIDNENELSKNNSDKNSKFDIFYILFKAHFI